jgi:hypothetical protein
MAVPEVIARESNIITEVYLRSPITMDVSAESKMYKSADLTSAITVDVTLSSTIDLEDV